MRLGIVPAHNPLGAVYLAQSYYKNKLSPESHESEKR